jgi:hypothetical protein
VSNLLTLLLLTLALLLERYCFLCTVTKTQNFSYMTVLLVILLNSLVNLALTFTQAKQPPVHLHELFQVERPQKISGSEVALIG